MWSEIESFLRPELIAQFLSSNHFSRAFQQSGQDLKRLFLERYSLPGVAQFPGSEMNLERTKADS